MKIIEIYWRKHVKEQKPIHNYATKIEVSDNFLICTDVDDNIHAFNMEDILSYHIMLEAPQNCQ